MKSTYQSQKLYAFSIGLISLPCVALVPNIFLSICSGIIGSVSLGYALSIAINTSQIEDELKAAKRLRNELQIRHSDALAIKKTFKESKLRHQNEIEAFKNQAESEVLDHKEKLLKLYDTKVTRNKADLEKEYLRKTKDYRSVQVARLAYVIREKKQLEEYLEQEWNKEVSEYKGFFQEFQEVLTGFEGQLKEAQTDFRASYKAKGEEIENLHNTLSRANNIKPFTGSDKASIVGNKVLDYFLKQGITLDAERALSKLDASIIWVRPRATSLKAIEAHLEALYLSFELVSMPKAEIADGCIKISLQDAKIKLPEKILEPPIKRFIDALQASNHIRLTAPTDSGKSALLDNILGIYSDIYSNQLALTLLDPKYPFTDWAGHQPDYKGFDECLGAMSLLQIKINQRLSESRKLADEGKSIPEYQPELFAIDELELLYADALTADGEKKGDVTKALIKSINTGLKIGRGLTKSKGKGIKVLYATQSPLCSKIGQNKDAFDQSTSIYLGSNIPLVLQDKAELDGKIIDAKRRVLEKEYGQRLAAGQQYLMLIRLPNGGDCFLMKCPKPGAFVPKLSVAGGDDASRDEPAPKTIGCVCPECGNITSKKNGRYRGRQRWKCLNDACKKNSFTEA